MFFLCCFHVVYLWCGVCKGVCVKAEREREREREREGGGRRVYLGLAEAVGEGDTALVDFLNLLALLAH